MKSTIKDKISRIKLELCRLDVRYDAGKYRDMESVYLDIKALLRDKLQDLFTEQRAAL